MISFIIVLSGIISAIWLLFYGEWKTVIIAIISIYCVQLVFSILKLPAVFFDNLSCIFIQERRKKLSLIFKTISLLIIFILFDAWCIFIFLQGYSRGVAINHYMPYLIFAYFVANVPIAAIAQYDYFLSRGDDISAIWSLGYMLMGIIPVIIGCINELSISNLIYIYGIGTMLLIVISLLVYSSRMLSVQ